MIMVHVGHPIFLNVCLEWLPISGCVLEGYNPVANAFSLIWIHYGLNPCDVPTEMSITLVYEFKRILVLCSSVCEGYRDVVSARKLIDAKFRHYG